MMKMTYADFLKTVAENEGEVLATPERRAMFRAEVGRNDAGVRFIPSSGGVRRVNVEGVMKYLAVFNETGSLMRKDYPAELFNRSYVLAIIQLWLGQRQADGPMAAKGEGEGHAASERGGSPEGMGETAGLDEAGEFAAAEGTERVRSHLVRERSRELVQLAKHVFQARNDGRLFCEVCGFDFGEVYGEADFIEVHHRVALRDLEAGTRTKVSDLAMVCANCHRMLHRGKRWPTVDELRERVVGRRNDE